MTQTPAAWQIKMLFDSQCPLCSREVAMLRKRNGRGLIAFEDIAEPGFDPARYGLTMPQVVGSMHAVRPDGSIVRGVDVFAEVYDAVGWRLLSGLIRWPLTRPLAKIGYRIFAAVRPKLSRFDPIDCAGGTCQTRSAKLPSARAGRS
jgi:predicted DCC family thiol-disulfide oxidoreductase YuxK